MDEAALKVLSEEKADYQKLAEERAKEKSEADKGVKGAGDPWAASNEIPPSLADLMAEAAKAKQEVRRKAILGC